MHLTLVKPNIGRQDDGAYVDEGRMEPLQLGVLAALTPPDVEIALLDDRVEPLSYDAPTDLVAITVETFTARRAYEIAAEYRRRGVPVVMGGFHATLATEEVAQHADAVFTGDAEAGWRQVVEDARAGRLAPIYRFAPGVGQGEVVPRRDLFRGKRYLPLTLVQFTRGCPFSCTYCAVGAYFDRRTYTRAVDHVLAELAGADPGIVFFVDDNVIADRRAAKELFRALIPLRLRWVGQASVDMTEDPALMDLMARSGCMGHVVGFESLSPASLQAMAKQPNLASGADRYRRTIEVLNDHGLQTWAAFTLGHDEDTVEGLRATVDFALEQRFAFAAFNVLVPYPSTPLYRRLAAEGRLLFDGSWWLHPDYRFNQAAFVPRRMTPDELTAAGLEARKRFNALPSRLARLVHLLTSRRSPARAALYWTYASLFRRETFRKQGMRLGLCAAREPAGELDSDNGG